MGAAINRAAINRAAINRAAINRAAINGGGDKWGGDKKGDHKGRPYGDLVGAALVVAPFAERGICIERILQPYPAINGGARCRKNRGVPTKRATTWVARTGNANASIKFISLPIFGIVEDVSGYPMKGSFITNDMVKKIALP
jgi:hypothetical protein